MKQLACVTVLLGMILVIGCGRPAPTRAGGQSEGLDPAPKESLITTQGFNKYDLETGESVYQKVCMVCHSMGVAGAPRYGSAEDWTPRATKGFGVLVDHALKGYEGEKGIMPAKGGNPALSDKEVAAAVAYMLAGSR